MDALDGNAIAGDLFVVFGREMTTACASCTACGASFRLAELRVYQQAPGAVARCAACGSVALVLVAQRGACRAHLPGLELHDGDGAAT